jgi:hypothetical protein
VRSLGRTQHCAHMRKNYFHTSVDIIPIYAIYPVTVPERRDNVDTVTKLLEPFAAPARAGL